MTEDEQDEGEQAIPNEPGLDELLAYLVESRGFDFVDYKRTGLARRLRKRLVALGLTSLFEYTDYLQVHPDEFGTLFNAILINATSFFRDPASWEYIAAQILPRIIEQRKGATIRVWSAGCATGQEAYSIAMLLADALGLTTFARSVKIYATDVDGSALTIARMGTYTSKEIGTGVPEAQLARYFEKTGDRYTFSKELRRSVIFGQHNLLHDAPISRVDLLLCRNTLMYFNADAQARILSNLHFALNDDGVLFLGKAEMLLTHAGLFTPLDKRRLFTKTVPLTASARLKSVPGPALRSERARQRIEHRTLREVMFELAPV
ncbi:MAG TPA: protein-glutamate O-methyltransferase CheR, partial [Polyangiales bacterium]